MHLEYDYIVVGSGATGAITAKTLTEEGVKVAILDVGNSDSIYKEQIPNTDFISLRREDKNQQDYFLGKNFEGLSWKDFKVGSQLTPPRNFLKKDTEKFLPFESKTFQPLESLAKGGLGGGWGLGCYGYSDNELMEVGLDPTEMKEAYQHIISYIGVSGEIDTTPSLSLLDFNNIQAPPILGQAFTGILKAYRKKHKTLNSNDFFLERTGLALLTKDKGDRKATQYNDMGFWSDANKSAYRSWITIEELEKKSNFSYYTNCLVTHFEENKNNTVTVYFKRTDTLENGKAICKKLILSPGPLGSARIVARSFQYSKQNLPIICNPYSYIPCLQPRRLGKEHLTKDISFSQMTLFLNESERNHDIGVAALFNYRSLLLHKLIKETPLGFADGRAFMQFLQSSFIIAGVHHPERSSSSKFIRLIEDSNSITKDKLTGEYSLSNDELRKNRNREKQIRWALRKLGCFPLKTIETPIGASIHYAGTLPFKKSNEAFSTLPNGKLGGTKNVFIADGSSFKYLPAKGLTLTLMANAYRVAKHVLKDE